MRRGNAMLHRGLLGLVLAGIWCRPAAPAGAALWSTGYYPGYRQSHYPPSEIDFRALSHIIHFSVVPRVDGTLDTATNHLSPAYSADLVSRAHAAGRKVLICAGGAQSQAGFRGATSAANRAAFIGNLTNFMAAYGYDGIDLDWEPLEAADAAAFTSLVNSLRAALDQWAPKRVLTAAVATEPSLVATLQDQFDQINLMTYYLSGPWSGWVTWFNAPIYDGGFRFPGDGRLVPSTDGMVSQFTAGGVAPAKLGIGLCFYGCVWAGGSGTSTGGVTQPRQSWLTAPSMTPVAYSDIISNDYQPALYHWDTNAQAAYLSISNPIPADDRFISYDDEHTCQAKVSYARNRALGGVMMWELGQGYRPDQPAGLRDPLLQSVKQALLATPDLASIQRANHDIQLGFLTLPLGLYRVLWTSNLSRGPWNTLTNNVPGDGGAVRVLDPGAAQSQAARFYRVQTPP